MTEVVGIKFKDSGRTYYFAPGGIRFKKGDKAIVDTSSGAEFGQVAMPNKMIDDKLIVNPLKKVLRKANKRDLQKLDEIKIKEEKALKICREKISQHKLDMKLIDAEYSFDMRKVSFFFISDKRVDFRDLVKDLASSLHARIELRQVGVRDQARLMGGLGDCGREFCCKRFLGEFHPVSIKMAKQQNLSLNPIKISGSCGRLMCCLKYEQDSYAYLLKRSPKLGDTVKTPDGKGEVVDINIISGKVKVDMEQYPSPVLYRVDEIKVLSRGKKNR